MIAEVTGAAGGDAVPELRGPHLRLRPLRETDAADRRTCGHDAEFARMLGHPHPASPEMTAEEAEQWLRSRMRQPACWAIEWGGRCVGTVGFVN